MITIEQARESFAEELRVVHDLKSPRLVEALARVPRDRFLGPGPWLIRGVELDGGPPRSTETADPRHVHHNVSVALDPSRHLYNGQPGLIATWLDALKIVPGDQVLHIGCGTGYFTALIAHMVGASGRVSAVEVDPDLAVRAGTNLAEWPWVTATHGDGRTSLPHDVDVVLVHAGATHVLDEWLDALADGGRLLVPLTCSGFGMPTSLSKGSVVIARRSGDEWAARLTSMVAIYSLIGGRDDAMNTQLGQAFMTGKSSAVIRLRRDVHDAGATCWLHGPTNCLTTA